MDASHAPLNIPIEGIINRRTSEDQCTKLVLRHHHNGGGDLEHYHLLRCELKKGHDGDCRDWT